MLTKLILFHSLCSLAAATAAYHLGANDILRVQVSDLPELKQVDIIVGVEGDMSVPLIGRVNVVGITVAQAEERISKELKRYLNDPRVSLSLLSYGSQPVSVLGPVRTPGVHQVQGGKRLTEVLSLAGGLREDAGPTIVITRDKKWGPIPLPSCHEDAVNNRYRAEVQSRQLFQAQDSTLDITIFPNDLITVLRESLVYVLGEVRKPGGFPLGERPNIRVLQALALGEGLTPGASASKARVLRLQKGSAERIEIPVDLKQSLNGHSPDLDLQPDDILFVPTNTTKKIALRAVDALIQTGSGVVIWRSAN